MSAKKYCTQLQEWLSQIRLPVYILVIMFAWASWIDINGLWTELPLLVNELPEFWDLPSYLVIIIQVANIGPILYTLVNRCAPNKVKEWPVIYIIILVGIVACTLLVFFWNETSHIFGEERSTSLLVLSFFLSMVDTTSSVVFLPYMANFEPQYMSAFYIGEGMCGFLPAMVGLIQGVGSDPDCRNISSTMTNKTTGENITEYSIIPFYDEPLFSVEIFFVFLLCMLVISGIAFSILNFSDYCKQEMEVRSVATHPEQYAYDNRAATDEAIDETELKNGLHAKTYSGRAETETGGPNKDSFSVVARKPVNLDEVGMNKESQNFNKLQFAYLFITSAIINGLSNGVIPSTASYSALPYGNRAYNLSTRIGMAANPLACFAALFFPCKSLLVLGVLSLSGTILAGYQLYLADMSPFPPLQDEVAGEFLVVSFEVHKTSVLICEAAWTADNIKRIAYRRTRALVFELYNFMNFSKLYDLMNFAKLYNLMNICHV